MCQTTTKIFVKRLQIIGKNDSESILISILRSITQIGYVWILMTKKTASKWI